MKSILTTTGLIIGAAMVVPAVLQGEPEKTPATSVLASAKPAKQSRGPKTAIGYRNRGGQFDFNTSMNGSNVRVLVDTGASSVAINQSTARRIGIKLSKSAFRYTANTANGRVKMARATIKEIRIGSIRVKGVEAAVLPDKSLDHTLLGMSFLNRLKKFEFQGNKLKLIQ